LKQIKQLVFNHYTTFNKEMKNIFLSIFTIIILTALSSSANELKNPGFETAGAGGNWDAANWNNCSSNAQYVVMRSDDVAYSNSYSLKIGGTGAWLAASQEVTSLSPGQVIKISGWVYQPLSDPLTNGARGDIIFTFTPKDAGDLGINIPILFETGAKDTWSTGSQTAVVPAGKTGVEIKVTRQFGGEYGGTVYFDEIGVEVIEESSTNENYCANPSFEEGTGMFAADWGNQQSGTFAMIRSDDVSRTGDWSMELMGEVGGEWLNVYQDITFPLLKAGQDVIASVYALQPSSDPLGAAQGAIIKLEWLPGNILASETWFLNGTEVKDSWKRGAVSATAPSGVTGVRLTILRSPDEDDGTVYFDDCTIKTSTLKNPGFETEAELGEDTYDAEYWDGTVDFALGRSDEEAHSGSWSCKISTNIANPSVSQTYIEELGGKALRFSVYTFTTNSDPLTADARVKIQWLPESLGSTQGVILAVGSPSDVWTQGFINVIAPSDTTGAVIFLTVDNPPDTAFGTIYFDDCELKISAGYGPATPVNLTPVSGSTGEESTPTLTASSFSSPTNATHTASRWQVTETTFDSLTWDSGEDTVDLLSVTVPANTLVSGGSYFWRVKYKDSSGYWSDWSNPTWFQVKEEEYVNFFSDGFNQPDGTKLGDYGKWFRRLNPVDLKCMDNMFYTFGGNGPWAGGVWEPKDINGNHLVLNPHDGITFESDLGPWTNTTDIAYCKLKYGFMNIPMVDDFYALNCTSLAVNILYYGGDTSTNLQIYLARKLGGVNSDGENIANTYTRWESGAKIQYYFNATTATITYNGEIVLTVDHGINVNDWTNWYCGSYAGNFDNSRCYYYMDNTKIYTSKAAQQDIFSDNFNGIESANVSSKKWRIYDGNATIENQQCKLTPAESDNAIAAINAKRSVANPLRMDPDADEALEYSFSINKIETTVTRTGNDMAFKLFWLPERISGDASAYNTTALRMECLFDTGTSNMTFGIYRNQLSGGLSDVIFTNALTYVPGGKFVLRFSTNVLHSYYNGLLIAESDIGIEMTNIYSDGVFLSLEAKNISSARGSVYIDDMRSQVVPEPVILWIVGLLELWIIVNRRK